MPYLLVLSTVLMLLVASAPILAENSQYSTLEAQGWKEKSFVGHTRYSLEKEDNKQIIRAESNQSASALYRKVGIDLSKTPVVSWQWKISNIFDNTLEKSKSGDDFPARVYVVYKTGIMPWSTVAINYVWSSSYDVGQTWPSAYTEKSKIMVVQSGQNDVGRWISEERNLAEDFKQLFNLDVVKIDGFAIMVDSDNTGSNATAWFADIAFSEEE